jgi:hypothetical protein
MADRQDIDALMIGALYGELDAAESARLDAHLSKHPEDRAAMDGLTRTRAALRENLDAMPAAEPPQAISAVLLQAAARQAPARRAAVEPERPGLWTRFVEGLRSFAMNPALAGAAALLLVGGAATVLVVRSGGKADEPMKEAKQEGAVARNDDRVEDGAFRYHAESPPEPPAPAATGTLDLKESLNADLDQQPLDRGGSDEARTTVADKRDNLAMAPERAAGGKAAKPKPTKGGDIAGSGYASIDATDVAPPVKDPFTDAEGDADDDSTGEETKAAEGRARGAAKATAQAPEPPSDKATDPALEEWAKREHGRLVKLVRDGKCPEAGRLGAEIKDRAPEYYAAHVANDRAIRSCKQYIEGQAKKKADKAYKSRSQGNTVDLEATE